MYKAGFPADPSQCIRLTGAEERARVAAKKATSTPPATSTASQVVKSAKGATKAAEQTAQTAPLGAEELKRKMAALQALGFSKKDIMAELAKLA
jgi:Holliday junction resolvasome RuvABC DNA-binding subunit